MTDDDRRILAGMSAEMLQLAIEENNASVIKGRAGEWERQRLVILCEERDRRATARIESQPQAA